MIRDTDFGKEKDTDTGHEDPYVVAKDWSKQKHTQWCTADNHSRYYRC